MGGLRRNCEMCGYAYKTRSQFEDNMPTRMSNSELVVEMLNVCKSFCRKCSRFLLLAGFILTLVAIVAAFVALWCVGGFHAISFSSVFTPFSVALVLRFCCMLNSTALVGRGGVDGRSSGSWPPGS